MKGPPLSPGGEDITRPNQVAPRGRKACSTRNLKPETSNHCLLVSVGVLGTSGRHGTRSRPIRLGRPLITVAASFDVRQLKSCQCHGTSLMIRLVFFAHLFPYETKSFVGRQALGNPLQFQNVAIRRGFIQVLNEFPLTLCVNRHEECVLQALEHCVGSYLLRDPLLDLPVSRTWYHHLRSIQILHPLVFFLHDSFPPRGREEVHDTTAFIAFIPVFYL